MLSEAEIQCRLPVWHALSDLFLDTELQPHDYRWIAEKLAASRYSREDVRRILEREVAPAFAPNLMSVAGEWTSWSEDEVRAIMLRFLRRGSLRRAARRLIWRMHRRDIEEDWAKVEAELRALERG